MQTRRGKAKRRLLQTVAMSKATTRGKKRQNQRAKRRRAIPVSPTDNWIPGYKITNLDGTSYCVGTDGQAVQYEQGKIASVLGRICVAENGLHFALDPLRALDGWPGVDTAVALWEVKANPITAVRSHDFDVESKTLATSDLFMVRKMEDEEKDRLLTGWMVVKRRNGDERHEYSMKARNCASMGHYLTFVAPADDDFQVFWCRVGSYWLPEQRIDVSKDWKSAWETFSTRFRSAAEQWANRHEVELKKPSGPFKQLDNREWYVRSIGKKSIAITYLTPFDIDHKNFRVETADGTETTAEHCPSLEEAIKRAENLDEENSA